MNKDLQALQDADFGWVRSLDSIWSDDAAIGAGPNQGLIDDLISELVQLKGAPNPPGRVFIGQAGIGKTHLVGEMRRRAWASNCWFVMLDVVGITDFWKSAALSFVTSLLQQMPSADPQIEGIMQYEAVISGVARRFQVEEQVSQAFERPEIEAKLIVDALVGGLMKSDMANALQHRDVFRALALLRSPDLATKGIAHSWLQGYDVDGEMRRQLGFVAPPPSPIQIIKGLLWVMGLAGPTLIAADQIDGVISSRANDAISELSASTDFTAMLGSGLLDLARSTGRGMLILACLPISWTVLKEDGPSPLSQSFAPPSVLSVVQDQEFVRQLIVDRLAPAYKSAGYNPVKPTDPFSDAAIASASNGITPRTILMRCDEHRRRCLAEGKVIACDNLGSAAPPPVIRRTDVDRADEQFDAAICQANIIGLLDDKDDGKLGMLLRDAFDLYSKQIPRSNKYNVFCRADPAQRTPPLHGRLTFIDHDANEAESHFCFRALQHSNAVALCARFKAALTASGIAAKAAERNLIVVRRGPPPSGPRTKELFDAFRAAGGIEIDPSDADLRIFVALRDMRDAALAESRFDAFERWLIERKPLCDTAFFKEAGLCPPPLPTGAPHDDKPIGKIAVDDVKVAPDTKIEPDPSTETKPLPGQTPPAVKPPLEASATIPVGHRTAGGEVVAIPTDMLPRHTAIIAGAGSGKTVLLRRLVEEAALAGIPAIVIDPNNDLSRLGDAWPQRPAGFEGEDEEKAAAYRDKVEVVVWTPGIHAGNPLFLSVLPDFSALGDDPDERSQAVTMAADTLGPLAGAKKDLAKGVLADALRHFAANGGGTLKEMTALLADLPEGVSEIDKAETIANGMANGLRAAVATNPLLKATGPVLDPKLLFFGQDPAKTRVSVINLSGLASDDAKEDFVNRLQMTLFGWIKKHPSPRGMLYVIDEAQTFIPAGAGALSKTSGVTLVAQARKYGLGMIVVTQAPKGIDNKVVSNCSTQFLGKQNAPATIEAAKELVAAAGGKADDLGKLKTGEFYFKTGDGGKPFKVRTPLCLSYHPANPPTPEEVVTLAKASAAM